MFGIGIVSAVINVLALTGSIFMLQVYDRVIPSYSLPTLVALGLFAALLYMFQGLLELIRTRLLVRISTSLDRKLSGPVYTAMMRLPLRIRLPGDGLLPLRDLDQIRGFIAGSGPTALFDMPWMFFYIALCFLFHFWIGVTALAGALVLIGLTLLTELRTRGPISAAVAQSATRATLSEATRRNAEAVHAMGLGQRITNRWSAVNAEYLHSNSKAADAAATFGTLSRVFRIALQSLILAVGAYLVINREATGGIMIASSILMSRALAPVELAIAHWRIFVSARQGWTRLSALLAEMPEAQPALQLPAPRRSLTVENLAIVPPGERKLVVRNASFTLSAGDGVGIIGPSASGKSSLARALAGIWLPAGGNVRLDGATLDQWTPEELGPHVGYLPQDVQLFDGTIAENISRFEPDPPTDKILKAAGTASVHDMIVHLQDGYDTRVGEAGASLSAGQRQRVALARALYGDPFLLILDEPNSNLDADGDAALTAAVKAMRERGSIVVVIAHRRSALENIDQVIMMGSGRIQAIGPKAEVLAKMARQPQASVPLKVVSNPEEIAS